MAHFGNFFLEWPAGPAATQGFRRGEPEIAALLAFSPPSARVLEQPSSLLGNPGSGKDRPSAPALKVQRGASRIGVLLVKLPDANLPHPGKVAVPFEAGRCGRPATKRA